MCGNVICGRFDPSQPFFTARGSFWTNCTTELLASTTAADRQARTRNRCNGEGYESVALFPLRAGHERLGLLQMNDRRKRLFSPDAIALWERLAGYLAVALAKMLAEEARRESEGRLRALGDQIPGGAIYQHVRRPDGRVSYAYMSAGIERLIGLSAQCVMADPDSFRQLIVEEDRARVAAAEERSARELASFDCEFRQRSVRGEIKWVQCRSTPRRLEDGSLLWDGIVVDITQRKQAEEALVEAKAAAEAANVAKSQFLASMSHELRTPMNAILGMTELALDEELSPLVRDYLSTTKESADALLGLLDEVLDLSRIESGKLQLESAPFDLRAVLDQTLKSLGVQAYEKGLELLCDVADDVPDALIGDPLRLRQILVNLLGNAVKFTPQGEVVVRVEVARPGSEDGGSEKEAPPATADHSPPLANPPSAVLDPRCSVGLCFSVQDTGIGISPEDQQRIFAAFTQADASTTRHYGGSGLGLTISRRLAGAMGGRVWLKSQPGRGSTFFFTAHLAVQSGPLHNPADDCLKEQLLGQPVLVVDDHPCGSRLLTHILARWGMQPEAVTDVPTGMARIQQRKAAGAPFCLAIINATHPGVDGITLAEWTKNQPALVRAKIVLLFAADRQAHARRCQNLDAVVADKPISSSGLWDAIGKALGSSLPLSPSSETPEEKTLGRPCRPLRVLMAEDIQPNQKLVQRVLGKRGHHVVLADNGREAIEWASREEFDVILMDVQMPAMDGFQATAAIRAMKRGDRRRLPIIALTAHALKGDAERCLTAGMDAYLSKPFQLPKLIEMVESLAEMAAPRPDAEFLPDLAAAGHVAQVQAGQPAGAAPAVFCLDEALASVAGDEELFRQMVSFFFDDRPKRLGEMQAALEHSDAPTIARAAHRLKGTVIYLGAGPVLQVLERLEQISGPDDLPLAAGLIPELEGRIAALTQALASYQDAHRP